jgi:POT family proton-dependent oligopeptide transporter
MGMAYPSSWFQSMNSMFIFMFAPVMAWLWIRMAKSGNEPTSPTKFAYGLIFVGAGFLILVIPARMSEQGALVSPMWLTATYFLHTIGELALSPVGLSAMTVLAPPRIAGLMMGVWFLATSVGNFIGGRVAGFYESMALPTLFGTVAAFAIVAGFILLMLVPSMRKLLPAPAQSAK